MFPLSARLAVCAGLLLIPAPRGFADEPASGPPRPRTTGEVPIARQAPAQPAPTSGEALRARVEAEAKKARTDADELLKTLPAAEADLTPAQKALRDVWNERLALIDDWRKTVKERGEAEKPERSADREIGELKAKIEQSKAFADQLAKAPESVMPEVFRLPPEQVDEAKLAEMSRAIDDRRAGLAERTSELEKCRAEPAAHATALHDLGIDRDRAHARKSTLPTMRASLEAAYASATTEEARKLAREKLVNFRWMALLAEERLAQAEAKLALETRRVEAIDLDIKVHELQVKVFQDYLAALSKQYAAVAERRKAALRTEAVREQARAAASDDPVVKFTARRSSEIHEMEAQLVEYDRLLSTNPALSLEEQKGLADHASADLESLKQVVKENRVGGLVALRLNNDFRRLSHERGMVQRNELAQSAALNAHYENALTEVELNFINDARDDRFERDAFIETLPAERRAAAGEAIDGLDARHKELLGKKKAVLEKLLDRAEKTHAAVERRLRTLDEQYAFIRTHIFWVRDSEPLSAGTLVQAKRDLAKIAAAAVRLAAEPLDRTLWTPTSADFGLMVVALVVLPPVIIYVRYTLKARLVAPRREAIVVRID